MQHKHKRTISACWHAAQQYLYEILGSTNPHTHKRWPAQKHDQRQGRLGSTSPKVGKISGHVVMRMSTSIWDMVQKGTSTLISTGIAAQFLQQIREQEGLKLTSGREWTRLFLRELGLSWKVSDPRSQPAFVGTRVQEARRHLLLKLAFLLEHEGIKATDVFNMGGGAVIASE